MAGLSCDRERLHLFLCSDWPSRPSWHPMVALRLTGSTSIRCSRYFHRPQKSGRHNACTSSYAPTRLRDLLGILLLLFGSLALQATGNALSTHGALHGASHPPSLPVSYSLSHRCPLCSTPASLPATYHHLPLHTTLMLPNGDYNDSLWGSFCVRSNRYRTLFSAAIALLALVLLQVLQALELV
jgi:hypothetical protein